jgi:hypothetical protein
VLRVFSFQRYRFRALSIECGNFDQINDLLKPHGYREVKNPYNRSRPWERYWLSD